MKPDTATLRIGTGAGFSGDRIDPAVELCEKGDIDYLIFECLGERTIALAQQAKMSNPSGGFDPLLEARMRAVLPLCVARNIRIITNMGAANPEAAGAKVRDIAQSLNITGLKIAVISGDDVSDMIAGSDYHLDEINISVSELGDRLISANAYIGAEPIIEALELGADVIIAGRAADPALFLAPQIHHFGWRMDDWDRLGRGTIVGHLLECAGQITGGYFADPGKKDVPRLAELGFPLAEINSEGDAIITKVEGSGGMVSEATCKEQLLYEIHDPSCYLQPDVIADITAATLVSVGPDRVKISGCKGHPRTEKLKVSVGYFDSWTGEGQITYAGPGCVERGNLALDILKHRLEKSDIDYSEIRGELIGLNSVSGSQMTSNVAPYEVRVRFVGRCKTEDQAKHVGREVEALYLNGPAGGGGVITSFRQVIAVASTLIPKEAVHLSVEILES